MLPIDSGPYNKFVPDLFVSATLRELASVNVINWYAHHIGNK